MSFQWFASLEQAFVRWNEKAFDHIQKASPKVLNELRVSLA